MTDTNTPTPRTDAVIRSLSVSGTRHTNVAAFEVLCYELERELATATARAEKAEAGMKEQCDTCELKCVFDANERYADVQKARAEKAEAEFAAYRRRAESELFNAETVIGSYRAGEASLKLNVEQFAARIAELDSQLTAANAAACTERERYERYKSESIQSNARCIGLTARIAELESFVKESSDEVVSQCSALLAKDRQCKTAEELLWSLRNAGWTLINELDGEAFDRVGPPNAELLFDGAGHLREMLRAADMLFERAALNRQSDKENAK